jgi:phosphate transport system permease protein
MTSTLTPPPASPPPPAPEELAHDLSQRRSGRTIRNGLATVLMGLAFVIVVVPLALVLITVISKGAQAISWAFLTEDIPPVRRSGPGMGPAVVGTLVITGTAALMAIPLGVLGAIYLHEYGQQGRLAQLLRFLADVMTGVPSIIMGLFIFSIWVVRFGTSGVTGFAGALALACLMLPIIIRSTEEMLRLVPDQQREASVALGASKARTTLTIVLPAAFPGILSGVLLAVARAAGETAPLLFTIGAATSTNWNPFKGPNTALSVQIFQNATQPFPAAQERAWGAALTLIVLTFILLVLSRLVAGRFDPARRNR